MAVKKQKKPQKRKRVPVTAGVTGATPGLVSKGLTGLPASSVDPVSVLMAMTPSGAETTSSTSSLLTVKSTKA
ncbi:hypothetical protein BGZ52_008775, partial [Haplosporangium bisporale]